MIAEPSRENALAVLEQVSKAMGSVRQRPRLPRHAAADAGRRWSAANCSPTTCPGCKRLLAEEFPSGDALMNRELIRVAGLSAGVVDHRPLPGVPQVGRRRHRQAARGDVLAVHRVGLDAGAAAGPARLLRRREQTQRRRQLRPLHHQRHARFLPAAQRGRIAAGARAGRRSGRTRRSARSTSCRKQLDDETRAALIAARRQARRPCRAIRSSGCRSASSPCWPAAAMRHRWPTCGKIWDESPERRQAAALGLAQQPGGENWTYLLKTLPILEPAAAREICAKLTEVDQAPAEAGALSAGDPARPEDAARRSRRRRTRPRTRSACLQFWTGEELAAGRAGRQAARGLAEVVRRKVSRTSWKPNCRSSPRLRSTRWRS